MSKNLYRAGEIKFARSDVLLGERPGVTNLRTRYLRDIEDELTRVQRELGDLRATYEREARTLSESYSQKKASLESDLAQIRRTSEEESKRIRDSAAAEVEKEKHRGHEEGFSAGRADGLADAAKSVAGDLEQAHQKIQTARDSFLDRVIAAEAKLFETALGIAERVVRQKIQVDPNVIKETVREVIAQIRGDRPVLIRVHPSDVDRLDEFKKHSPETFRTLPTTFVPDETLTPGDCVAETGLEFIDASVNKKLETLRDRLIVRSVV